MQNLDKWMMLCYPVINGFYFQLRIEKRKCIICMRQNKL